MYGLSDLFSYLSRKTVTKALVTFATLILSDPCFLGKAHSTTFNLLVSQCIGRLFESCWYSILKCLSFAFCWFLSVPLLSTSILCLFVCFHYFVDQKHVQSIKLDRENFKILIILRNCQNPRNNTQAAMQMPEKQCFFCILLVCCSQVT